MKIIRQCFSLIWSLFLNGLFTLLPITVTIALFVTSFRLILGWLAPLHDYVEQTFLGDIPYSELLLIIIAIFLVGTIMKVLLLRTLVHAIEALLFKLPLIRPVYSGIKQLVDAFSIQDKITFKQVILVEFPRAGVYSIGFLTSELPEKIAPINGRKFFNVFIPTTPNPTSGFFVILTEEDLTVVDLTRQEAMAMIISGGIIQPERLSPKNKP